MGDSHRLRLIWGVAEGSGTYGAIVRMLLLTGARKSEVAAMRHSMIVGGVWKLPGSMTKNHEELSLKLPQVALGLIAAQPRVDEQDLVFSLDGKHEFQNWGKSKLEFDRRCTGLLTAAAQATDGDAEGIKALPNWRVHDLRRTARSLMSRAGVPSEHAERVLNHKVGGIVGVYDKHPYEAEKASALEKLAELLEQIIHPPTDNVVPLARSAAR